MKKTRLNEYVYDFSVDYDVIAVNDVLDIHKYLMEKMVQYKMFGFIRYVFAVAMTMLTWANSLIAKSITGSNIF